MRRLQSREEYRQLLEKMWGFYRPVEESLAALDWAETEVDFSARRKTPWLAKDLVALGSKTELLPLALQFPQPRTLAAGIGCLYVLEGATLGGQIIAQHLKKIGVGPDTGGSFYASYGDKIGEMWGQFKRAATAYCVDDKKTNAAVASAVETFAGLNQWFAVKR